MRRTAQLEHHVVGNIDQRRHAALTATREPIHHPCGGCRPGVDVANHAAGKTATQIWRADTHGQSGLVANRHSGKGRRLEGRSGQCSHFTRNTIHTQAMGQVGSQLEREQGVVQLQVLPDILANACVCRELQQATVVFRQFKFTCRAQHALAFNTAQLAYFDKEGLAIVAGR